MSERIDDPSPEDPAWDEYWATFERQAEAMRTPVKGVRQSRPGDASSVDRDQSSSTTPWEPNGRQGETGVVRQVPHTELSEINSTRTR